jgi:hypothetical protein
MFGIFLNGDFFWSKVQPGEKIVVLVHKAHLFCRSERILTALPISVLSTRLYGMLSLA